MHSVNAGIGILASLALQLAIIVATKIGTWIDDTIHRTEKARQAAEEATNTYKDTTSSIDDYVSKYQELRKTLIAAKRHEEETYNVKKQLLELQTELNDKLGDQYGKINLVTDAYKDQTNAIKAYNKEAANTFLNENQDGIRTATDKMTDRNHYNLSQTGIASVSDEGKALQEIAEKYADQGVRILDELGDHLLCGRCGGQRDRCTCTGKREGLQRI